MTVGACIALHTGPGLIVIAVPEYTLNVNIYPISTMVEQKQGIMTTTTTECIAMNVSIKISF